MSTVVPRGLRHRIERVDAYTVERSDAPLTEVVVPAPFPATLVLVFELDTVEAGATVDGVALPLLLLLAVVPALALPCPPPAGIGPQPVMKRLNISGSQI